MSVVLDPAKDLELTHSGFGDGSNAIAYDSDGVDLSLVRSMLRKTPTERLQAVQDVIDLLASARRAGPR